MADKQVVTYCRICEPLCGLVATVRDDRLVQLRPDPDNPLSRGFACPKGIAMAEVQNDPERVLHPLRRTPDGEFERVSWDEALDGIAARLKDVPRDSIGWYFGNPATFSYSHPIWLNGFMGALGSPHVYSAGSQDVNNRFAASALLYGSPLLVPIPDLKRTDLLLMLGANPLVSHGSLISAPRIKEELAAIRDRGGRVVVVDPRRTETAKAHEHLPIRPDTDAWLLLSLLQVIFAERLEAPFEARGTEALKTAVAPFTPEHTETRTGIPAEDVRTLARDLAAARHAAVYGRIGSCLGRFGTLTALLIDALNLVTGNLDREGGVLFGRAPLPVDHLARIGGLASYGRSRSRIGGYPDVLGTFPAGVMAREITTPGPGRLRALFVSAGNPANSLPGGLPADRLDLLVCIDLYLSDTARQADYVLPATTFLEREDFPLAFGQLDLTPHAIWTEAVVPPRGEARQEWQIIEDLARRMGLGVGAIAPQRLAHRLGVRPGPRMMLDALLRIGPYRLSLRKLRRHPHGLVLADHQKAGTLRKRMLHKDGRVHVAPPEILAEIRRLTEADEPADYPLRLIGLRELRSHNSWMHNVPGLMRGKRTHLARINDQDAAERGIADGDLCRITSARGSLELPAKVTDELAPGTVAVPHGWGHQGGWSRANAAGGANVNDLADPEDLEPLAGMARLNGIPVRLEAVSR
ncbi:molybdopterin-dependent oxidoreductase [Actinocorallia sp. B10E7]|uniref:molybdopterin-containing oxidoreductase family protein n=1 Tax=Actinocorallia sp. B10E7 TaxID=3153558 RepID=UPI00325F23D1